MKFFKPEDFDLHSGAVYTTENHRSAAIANEKIEREGKVVYGDKGFTYMQSESSRYKALLICIEPLETCKHPAEKVHKRQDHLIHGLVLGPKTHSKSDFYYECDCGARVEPSGFRSVE